MFRLLNKREKIISYLTIAMIIFSLGFRFLLSPLFSRWENLNKKIHFTRVKLKKYLRLLTQKETIQKRYNKFYAPDKVSVQKEDIVVTALSELETLSKEANIRILDLRPQAAVKSRTLHQETLIELRAEGTMEGYLKFIYNLENSPSLLKIKKFTLTAKPNTQILEGSFSISQLSISE